MFDYLHKDDNSSQHQLDSGLAAMQLILAAHARGYDTNPMGTASSYFDQP